MLPFLLRLPVVQIVIRNLTTKIILTGLAIRRLMYEIEKLRECPVVGCTASPRDDNLLSWFAIIEVKPPVIL